jgi:flagellar motor protein MotB
VPRARRSRSGCWLIFSLAAAGSCATAGARPSARDLDPRDASATATAKRVEDWQRLYDALSSLADPCGAVGKTRDSEPAGIVLPVDCFFSGEEAALGDKAQPVVASIARELKGMGERDFWIDVRGGGVNPGGGRLTSARASALVAALVQQGVAPERLAAVVGFGSREADAYEGPRAPPAGTAIVEIIVAPGRDEGPPGMSR